MRTAFGSSRRWDPAKINKKTGNHRKPSRKNYIERLSSLALPGPGYGGREGQGGRFVSPAAPPPPRPVPGAGGGVRLPRGVLLTREEHVSFFWGVFG